MKERMFKAGKFLIILICASFIGLILLMAVYALPVSPMKENIARSSDVFNIQGLYPRLVPTYNNTQLDNVTDALMLATAIYPAHDGTGIAEEALHGYRYELEGEDMPMSLTKYANDANDIKAIYQKSYERFWNGYLVYLKPLLCVFDYGDILVLNVAAQLAIAGLLIYLAVKKNMDAFLPAFLAMLITIFWPSIMLSLQYSSVFYITLLFSVYLLYRFPQKISPYTFFILGIVTCYMDLLTYPMFTLGIPLVLYAYVNTDMSGIRKIADVIKQSALWSLGYLGMFIAKWTIASAILKQNVFLDAITEMMNRTSNGSFEKIGHLQAIMENITDIAKWPYVLVMICSMVIYFHLEKHKKNPACFSRQQELWDVLIYALICCYPLAWFAVLSNQTYEHSYFTYRTLGVSVFAFLMMVRSLAGICINKREHWKMENK